MEGVARLGLVGAPEPGPEERSTVWRDSWDPSVAAADVLEDCALVFVVNAAAAAHSTPISEELRVMISIPNPVTMILRPPAPAPPPAAVSAMGGRVGVE
jgi:hypothetical protein